MPEPVPLWPGETPVPSTYHEALQGLVNREFLGSQRWQQQQWRADRAGANPGLLEFERRFIRRMTRLGIPVFAAEFVRSEARQNDLYALGNSRARGGESPHQFGLAFDLVHSVHGWNIDRKAWALIGHAGKELAAQAGVPVEWGGDWKFYDPAHWQLADWKDKRQWFPWKL